MPRLLPRCSRLCRRRGSGDGVFLQGAHALLHPQVLVSSQVPLRVLLFLALPFTAASPPLPPPSTHSLSSAHYLFWSAQKDILPLSLTQRPTPERPEGAASLRPFPLQLALVIYLFTDKDRLTFRTGTITVGVANR